MSRPKKLTPLEYHKQHIHMYRTVSNIKHEKNFKAVIRGGELCIVDIDKDGNEVRNPHGN